MGKYEEAVEAMESAIAKAYETGGPALAPRDFAVPALAAALQVLREPENEMLAVGYEAMFEDKWDGTQAAMMGAIWQAMLDALAPQAEGVG